MTLTLDRIEKYLADHPEITAAGWSLAAGLDNSTIRHMMKFRRNPRIDTLQKLADAVGEPIEYFTAEVPPDQTTEIQRLFALLSPEEQAMIKTTLAALVAQRRGPAP
jgi:transcriptional regulator with XRE-family HTH domain